MKPSFPPARWAVKRPVSATWRAVASCPACGSTRIGERALLAGSRYSFGRESFAYPDGGVPVCRCADCALVYKAMVPSPQHLGAVFRRQAGEKWMEPYGFARDVGQLVALAGSHELDILDVGAGSGALLRACDAAGLRGRRSVLDIVAHPGVLDGVDGEFIHGFLDDEDLNWSGMPYDIVTLFDVLEHLYRPQAAFRNLRRLVRNDGAVVIETGNVTSHWPRHYGVEEWWYARLFEHHIFWSRASLERIATDNGLHVACWQECRHKQRVTLQPASVARDLVKVGCYRASPSAYSFLAVRLGKVGAQPWSPLARDHMRVVLRVGPPS